jgi:hypothetical protein
MDVVEGLGSEVPSILAAMGNRDIVPADELDWECEKISKSEATNFKKQKLEGKYYL